MSENYPWRICEDSFDRNAAQKQESLFTVANGFIGIRGDCDETSSGHREDEYSNPGTFLNGFYEMSDICYGERAYGFAEHSQTMLKVCNAKQIETFVNGQRFCMTEGTVLTYKRFLDMKHGYLDRTVVWRAPDGKEIEIRSQRMASLARPHLVAVSYSVKALNFDGAIEIVTAIDCSVRGREAGDDPRVESVEPGVLQVTGVNFLPGDNPRMAIVTQKTKRTQFSLACAALDEVPVYEKADCAENGQRAETRYAFCLKAGESVRLNRYISYFADPFTEESELESGVTREVRMALAAGFSALLQEQTEFLRKFWDDADIQILGDRELTRAMRFNLFQLLQSVGRNGATSIAAKGLSGEGYGGHYFWESETYVMPVFLYSRPDIAKEMLEYRYSILDNARRQARLLGHEKGALYAWRSINGEECSGYFPGGSAQYHISADVALAVVRYLGATGDMEFLVNCGLEILLETARLWINAGHYAPSKGGAFCIDEVTGPDEYTALVDNNCYTNAMARENLWNAVRAARKVMREAPDSYRGLCEKIGFRQEELEEFQRAADSMYLPFDEKLGIYKQDDTFLDKKVLNLAEIPPENHPLLLHYHPLFIYRHQVCKQADLILAEFLLPDRFELEQKARDYAYYEKVTTHDSSLSACVFSVMACEIGEWKKAYGYFLMTVRTDLDDIQGNTGDGLHMANMAGAWSCIVNGFAGFRISGEQLFFRPVLPDQWEGYRFSLRYRDAKIRIEVNRTEVVYRLTEGNQLEIWHDGEELVLKNGTAVSRSVISGGANKL